MGDKTDNDVMTNYVYSAANWTVFFLGQSGIRTPHVTKSTTDNTYLACRSTADAAGIINQFYIILGVPAQSHQDLALAVGDDWKDQET